MKISQEANWLVRTGQLWKIHVALTLLLVSSAVYLYFNFFDVNIGRNGEQVSLMALVFSVCWLLFSLRCDRCGRSVVYRMMKRDGLSAFTTKLLSSQVCPCCGHDGQRRSENGQ